MKENSKLYRYPMALTQQFKMCGNPFRIDTYKGCDFGCKYCFVSNRKGNFVEYSAKADFNIIENNFKKAFDTDKEYKNITIELMRKRVPLHLGGMSDPFQKKEFTDKITYKLLELSKKYQYPIVISTKTGYLPQEYFDVLDKNLHTFQISLISSNEDSIRKFESNTYSALDRMKLMEKLYNMGFWVSLRLQPIIDIEEAIQLVKKCSNFINYITAEHLKISMTNKEKRLELEELILANKKDYISTGIEFELKTDIKKENINKLKAICKVPIGCADNDLHELSDNLNCCGIDLMPPSFKNWIKYNSMYLTKTNDYSVWHPNGSCQQCFNSECRKDGFSFKDYVDESMK